ncbi:MAG TPA: substrate-binding domain-containing protein [Gemmatimonadaceae bacterium]|nr:substrate-binding domain-containing protein [Gemmatimonadaceae bacterium]
MTKPPLWFAALVVMALGTGLELRADSAAAAARGQLSNHGSALPMHDSGADPDVAALRVCSDPNNLPFSNEKGEGFENRIASLVASELHVPVSYTWWAQRRGFIRNTLRAGRCDVVIGIPRGDEMVLTTRPYYRSTYVFVWRKDRHYDIRSFDDPRLKKLKVGVHVIGDDYNALPPGIALARRGIVKNVVGYSIYGDYSKPSPPADLIRAVAHGDVDVAIAWGPLAGYYAAREHVPLEIAPVSPRNAIPGMPFDYAIAIGVRRGDSTLAKSLDAILVKRRGDIDQILRSYGVPLVDTAGKVIAVSAAPGTQPCERGTGTATCD